MSAFFLKVLNISITAGWLVLAVVLLRFALKKAPKWVHCMLWGLVALRLLLPFTIESKLSLLPSAEPIRTETVTVTAVRTATDPQTRPAFKQRIVLDSGLAAVDNAVNLVMPETERATAKTDTGAFVETAARVWAIGTGAMLLYAAASFVCMKFRVRASLETERGVFVCDEVHSPFVLGAIRPKIYLPSGLNGRERFHILAHERAHLSRLDHLWKPLGFLLLSVNWFNPLIWLAFVLLSRDIELACDEKVIAQLDAEGKASYSVTLLAFSRTHRAIAACPVAFGEVGVKKRVRSVLHYRKSAKWVVFIAFAAFAAFAVCFLTSPVSAKAAETLAGTQTEKRLPELELPLKKKTETGAVKSEQPESNSMEAPPYMLLITRGGRECNEAE